MVNEQLLKTGQVSGLTGIPLQTLRRYITEYSDFFSDMARKPTRGRRFTQQDIKGLLLIRHLYFERYGSEKIRAALRGDWQPPAKAIYDNQDAITLVHQAKENMQATDTYTRQAKQAANQANNAANLASRVLENVREATKHKDQAIDTRIAGLEKRIAALEAALAQQKQQKRGGFFGLGG